MMKHIKRMVLFVVFCMVVMATSFTVHAAVKVNNGKTSVITQGYTKQLKVTGTKKKVTKWSSSNTKIATVNSKGVVKGVKAGTCTIKAKIGTKVYSCKVAVKSNQFVCNNQNPDTWTYGARSVTFNVLKAYYKNGCFVCEGFWHNGTNLSYSRVCSEVDVYVKNGSTQTQIAGAKFRTTFGNNNYFLPNQRVKETLTFYPDQFVKTDLCNRNLNVITVVF